MRGRSTSSSAARRLGPALLLVGLACGGAQAPPAAVTDASGLLGAEEQRAISRQHGLLLRDHDIDYRVDVAPGAGDLLAYGVRRFGELGVGSRSRDGRGLLLVLDPEQDRVRLEVGRSLEGVFPDAFVAYLEERQMVPFFRAGRVADGILAATELVVTRAQQSDPGDALRTADRPRASGGGAEARAAIGAGSDGRFASGPAVAGAESPLEAVAAYLAAMRARNGSPDLELYSERTRRMLRKWVMTPGQMDAVVASYRRCPDGAQRVDERGARAVVRYPVAARRCAPWLLVREDERWRLDLASAQQLIRFGSGNAWHFATGDPQPYAFAFSDWRLDRHGFPHAR